MSDKHIDRWTTGAHHVGLTVPDLGAALRFFTEGLGYEQVGAVPSYPAAFVSDGVVMLTLWQAEDPAAATPFDRRRNLGLHHLALRVREESLDALHERLAARDDVEIEFAPEPLGGGPARHMMARACGGIRLEFIAPGAGLPSREKGRGASAVDQSTFHAGEQAIQLRAGVCDELAAWGRKVVRPFRPEQHREFYRHLTRRRLVPASPFGFGRHDLRRGRGSWTLRSLRASVDRFGGSCGLRPRLPPVSG